MNGKKLICRCREISEEEIREAVRNGASDADAVKRMSGAGMGLCQGRSCALHVARIISEEAGVPVEKVKLFTQRAPIRPVPIGVLSFEI